MEEAEILACASLRTDHGTKIRAVNPLAHSDEWAIVPMADDPGFDLPRFAS